MSQPEFRQDEEKTAEIVFNHIGLNGEAEYKSLVGRLAQDIYEFRQANGGGEGQIVMAGIALPGPSKRFAEITAMDSASAIVSLSSGGNEESDVAYVYNDGVLSIVDGTELIAVPPDSGGLQTTMIVFAVLRAAILKSAPRAFWQPGQ